jgi:TonB family protein
MRNKSNWTRITIAALALLFTCAGTASAYPQSGRPDDAPSAPPIKKPSPRPKPPPKAQPRATLVVKVVPPDSTVLLDTLPAGNSDPGSGSNRFTDLKVAAHSLVVRREGYRDESRTLKLVSGDNDLVTIVLEPLLGTLTVLPNVTGAEITLRSNDTNLPVTTRNGSLESLTLWPGNYELSISKSGYQTATRSIVVKPAQSIYLEPKLDAIVAEKPRPVPVRLPFVPLTSSVKPEGKYLIVSVRGASGDATAAAGTINVAASQEGSGLVTGSLSGQPCAIEFVRLENVAESALVETPGPSNQWSRVIVRVRPKDAKRLVRFAINWRTVPGTAATFPARVDDSFSDAEPLSRVRPLFPAQARVAHATGTVTVSVAIDEQGNVISAKATDGPVVFRPAAENAAIRWKFRPATRDGRPTPSTQTIRFNFEN